jgi:hypothetical protein
MNTVFDPALMFISDSDWQDSEKRDNFLEHLLENLRLIDEHKVTRVYWTDELEEILWNYPQLAPWRMSKDWSIPLVPIIYNLFDSNRTFTDCPGELDPCQVKPPLNFIPDKREIRNSFMKLTHRVVGQEEYIYLCLGVDNRLPSNLRYIFFCECHENELEPNLINDPQDWLKYIETTVIDGAELWGRRERLFHSLVFCGDVRKQLEDLSQGNILLQPVIKKLFELERYCRDWNGGPFNPDLLSCKVTTESARTLAQYGNERTFLCPDGENRVFSWHARLTPHARRIHFYPVPETRQIMIGYIGPHLPTANDPT